MGRCPYSSLGDVEDVLEVVRQLGQVVESKPGIFYIKSQSFLHFHIDKELNRWADVRDGLDWGESLPLPLKPSLKLKKIFLQRYAVATKKLLVREVSRIRNLPANYILSQLETID